MKIVFRTKPSKAEGSVGWLGSLDWLLKSSGTFVQRGNDWKYSRGEPMEKLSKQNTDKFGIQWANIDVGITGTQGFRIVKNK